MEMEEPITSDDDYARHRQLVPVDAVTPSAVLNVPASEGDHSNSASPKSTLSASKFTLPEGWSVKKVPRQFGGIIDKYYHDPETGRQFRSLKEVERYISKGITPPKTRAKRLKYPDEKVENHTTEGVTPTRTRVKRLTYPPDAKDENQTTEGVTPTKTRGKRVKCHHDEKVSPKNMLSASKFTLPDGWSVKKVPRRSGGLTDKYYCDPETGRQFRSLKEVERYIYEGVTPPSKRLKYYHDEKVENHTTEAVTPNSSMGNKVSSKSTLSASKFTLPEGWSVEKVPRKFGDITDKYYRDPETGLQFRSLKDVERYISEGVTPPKTRAKRQKYYPDKNVENQTTEGITPTRTRGKRVNYYDDETVENQTTEEVTPTKTRGKRVSPKNMLSASTFTLPEGWSVTNVARISGGHTDKFYRDPETGRQFRSLREVERYISEGVTPRRVNNGGADYGYLIKLLLVGDSGVGKSCLLLRFSDGSFSIIGIDSKTKTVELDGKQIKLQITTAGQERFRTLTTAYFRGAIGILLVYDVTDESSFNNIRNWIQNIEKHASGNAKKILVGNKADTDESNRVVPTSKGQALADEYGIKFFETSAKMNLNVDQVFFSVAADIVQSLADSDSMAEPSTIDINQPEGGGANDQPAQKSAP